MLMFNDSKDFIQTYQNQNSILIQNYHLLDKNNKIHYFNELREVASDNLSLAHCIQHDQAAKITLTVSNKNINNNFLDYVACNSTHKTVDTCYIQDNQIYGRKLYVSGLPFTDYAVIYINNKDTGTIDNLLLWADEYETDLSSFKPIGMEGTATGDIVFTGQKINQDRLLVSKNTPEIRFREAFMDLAFPTNCIGLCFGLFDQVKEKINSPQVKDLEFELYAYEKIWLSCIESMVESSNDTQYYHNAFLLYGQGKKTLNNIIKLVLDAGTGYFHQINKNTQKFRDALIYTSHMNNYKTSLEEFCRHRRHFE